MQGRVTASPAQIGDDRRNGPLYQADLSVWPVPGAQDDDGSPLTARVIQIGPEAGLERAPLETPVVFLHGLVGLNDHWDGVVQRVRHRVRCTLFELPLLRLEGSHCSIQGVTALTERFLRERIGGPAVLVGNSFGGHVALRLAIEHPALVSGLVLAGSSGLIEKSIVSDVQIRPSREWLSRKIGELFFDQAFMRESDLDRAYGELSRRSGARAMVKLSRSARRDVLRGEIGRIIAPTLLIWGRQDVVTPPEAAHGFNESIRRSRLVWFERCGHAPMIECPEPFAAEMLAFLESLAPAPAR